MKSSFGIGELAREFGVSLRTLRFYEDKGLFRPERRGARRLYSRRDRARLKLALMGKRVGFSLGEIKEMLDLYDIKDGQATQLRFALAKFQQQVALLRRQEQDVKDAIAELTRTMEVIAAMLRSGGTSSGEDIPEAAE